MKNTFNQIISTIAAAISTIVICSSVVSAGPTTKINIANNTAVLATSVSESCAAAVSPAFANLLAGASRLHQLTRSFPSSFACRVRYTTSSETCRFYIARTTVTNCNPVTGVCTFPWSYPAVTLSSGTAAKCGATIKNVQDLGVNATSANGGFDVDLTLK